MSPLGPSSAWDQPSTVSGFARSAPNPVLLEYVARERLRVPDPLVVDIGSGAGRNAAPIAQLGARVIGLDLSAPMIDAAIQRDDAASCGGRTSGPYERLVQ